MRGITITYVKRTKSGEDAFGAPTYTETEETVDNVLVSPTTSDDVISETDLEGKKLVYTLAIPKSDSHEWTDCKVKFFGKTFKSFGMPIEGIEDLVPTVWNKKVTVELYE